MMGEYRVDTHHFKYYLPLVFLTLSLHRDEMLNRAISTSFCSVLKLKLPIFSLFRLYFLTEPIKHDNSHRANQCFMYTYIFRLSYIHPAQLFRNKTKDSENNAAYFNGQEQNKSLKKINSPSVL